jgi:uroporphyrinogen decarboxylase
MIRLFKNTHTLIHAVRQIYGSLTQKRKDSEMNKIERIRTALAGKPVDYPPFTFWYHMGTPYGSAELTARVHLEFFKAYDLDLMKVMNDYEYPMPEGMDYMSSPADLRRLTPLDILRTPLGTQLQAISMIAQELKGKALLVDTVFDPWFTIRRYLLKEAMPKVAAEHPDALEAAIKVVNQNLIQYALACLQRGAAGIFYAIQATAETVTREQYERFMRPYNLEFLEAIQGKGECHILHAHGEKIYLDRLLDYPAQVISWADLNGGPPIPEMRKKTTMTLMAGIDHVKFPFLSTKALREQVAAARALGENTKFILAPGCSVETFILAPFARAAREAARS